MSKAIQGLVFASALCAAPMMISAQTIENSVTSTDVLARLPQDIGGTALAATDLIKETQDVDDYADDSLSDEDSDVIAPFMEEDELEGQDIASTQASDNPAQPSQDVAVAAPATEQLILPVQDVFAAAPSVEQPAEPVQDIVATAPSTEQPGQAPQDVAVTAPLTEQPTQPAQDVAAAVLPVEQPAEPVQDVVITAPSTEQSTVQNVAVIIPSAEEPAQSQDVTAAAPVTEEPETAVASAQDVSVDTADESFDMAPGTTDLAGVNDIFARLDEMNGKDVFDRHGGLIGRMTGCDEETGLVAVELSDGRMVSLLPELLTDMGIGVIADMMAGDVMTAADQIDSDPKLPAITY
jgi:hypothetical protein